MSSRRVPFRVLIAILIPAWLGAGPIPVGKLHTEQLRERFGPVGVTVIRQDAVLRIVDIETRGPSVARRVLTRAYSSPNPDLSPELRPIHAEIRAGASMGETFKRHGFEVLKQVVHAESVRLSPGLKRRFHTEADRGNLRIYELYARRGSAKPELYSTVAELDAPEVTRQLAEEPDQLEKASPPASPKTLAALRTAIRQSLDE